MIEFAAVIQKFGEKGEKSGWSYIDIPPAVIQQLNPGTRQSFRVKGKLDAFLFKFMALVPMGNGNFIFPLNAETRQKIKKEKGEQVKVWLELESEEKPLCLELVQCLEDAPEALQFFKTLPPGHQRYFSNWIDSAKTESTKAKRILQSINALGMGLGYPEMIRMNKKPI